jgi:hypothetical protein
MSTSVPDATNRWRCAACGNLTRFDVVRTATVREFWHFDLGGEHLVEESETDRAVIERVSCRWCGRDDAVELVPRAGAAGAD